MNDQQRAEACVGMDDPISEIQRLQEIEYLQSGWVQRQTAYEIIGIKFEQLMKYSKELTDATEPPEIKKAYEALVDIVKEFSDGQK